MTIATKRADRRPKSISRPPEFDKRPRCYPRKSGQCTRRACTYGQYLLDRRQLRFGSRHERELIRERSEFDVFGGHALHRSVAKVVRFRCALVQVQYQLNQKRPLDPSMEPRGAVNYSKREFGPTIGGGPTTVHASPTDEHLRPPSPQQGQAVSLSPYERDQGCPQMNQNVNFLTLGTAHRPVSRPARCTHREWMSAPVTQGHRVWA